MHEIKYAVRCRNPCDIYSAICIYTQCITLLYSQRLLKNHTPEIYFFLSLFRRIYSAHTLSGYQRQAQVISNMYDIKSRLMYVLMFNISLILFIIAWSSNFGNTSVNYIAMSTMAKFSGNDVNVAETCACLLYRNYNFFLLFCWCP